MEIEPCHSFSELASLSYLIECLVRLGPGFIQGSMQGNNILFQLYWRNRTLQILQFGIVSKNRKNGLAKQWMREIMSLCIHHKVRIIARNVQDIKIGQKLCEEKFISLGNMDFAFPF